MVIKIFSLSPWLETSEQASVFLGLRWWLGGKGSICNTADIGSNPGSGRSLKKETATHSRIPAWRNNHGYRSFLAWRNTMDTGAWPATANGVTRVGHS